MQSGRKGDMRRRKPCWSSITQRMLMDQAWVKEFKDCHGYGRVQVGKEIMALGCQMVNPRPDDQLTDCSLYSLQGFEFNGQSLRCALSNGQQSISEAAWQFYVYRPVKTGKNLKNALTISLMRFSFLKKKCEGCQPTLNSRQCGGPPLVWPYGLT